VVTIMVASLTVLLISTLDVSPVTWIPASQD
jgi:hypothetical protein